MSGRVPVLTQFASRELINGILYHGYPRGEDPRWRESGAPDLAAYERWSVRWCGMACLRMALMARDRTAPSLYELTLGAMAYGAYSDELGQPEGLIYQPFVNYVHEVHHLYAEVVTQLTSARLCAEIEDGRLVIASVNPEIRRPHLIPPLRSGGHLVLVTAAGADTVTFHDPAGHRPEAILATLPRTLFGRFSAGRGVTLKLD